MRIGLVSKWFNRGQSYVVRQIRSALGELGHETWVMARPSRDRGPQPAFIDRRDEWAGQPGVTEASTFEVPLAEYEAWVSDRALETILFDNCFQFAEIAALRSAGVRTVGRFVWEMFAPTHAAAALEAFDDVYSLTRCEQDRYADLGIESPRVPWGVHPELIGGLTDRDEETVLFYFPGGLMGPRKPRRELVEAFGRCSDPDLRLLIKAQSERHAGFLSRAVEADPRIEVLTEDLPTAEHRALFAGCDVCLAPTRWEGLGVFLYEAIGLGMPIITNDHPPMNEVVAEGVNGLLVPSLPDGLAESGIPAVLPDVDALATAIARLADPALRMRLGEGAVKVREELSWERTVAGLERLVNG